MPNYFYVSEDDVTDGDYDIYRFTLANGTVNNSSLQLVNSITPGSSTTQDIEGLATLYRANSSGVVSGVRIDGVSEGNNGGTGSTPQGYIETGVDAGNPAPNTVNLNTTGPAVDDRNGNETGTDYYFNASNLNDPNNGKFYNIQSQDAASPFNSTLYTINPANGSVSTVGTQTGEFADGLAINSKNGNAFASDFATQDGDGNELYKVNLSNGALTSLVLKNPNGTNFANVNFDSGLAFDSTGKLYALTEDGTVYAITNITNTQATIKSIGTINPAGTGELEGFAIINEPNTPSTGRLAAAEDEGDSSDSDRIVGTTGEDVLSGTTGNDSIYGKAGKDSLEGSEGDDILSGNVDDDNLSGGDGRDILLGGRGSDVLVGGLGQDVLVGDAFAEGTGSDTFVIAAGDGTDRITDFQIGEDLIGLSGGLDFGSLSISQSNGKTKIALGEEVLAVLDRVNADELIAAPDSFIIV
jgi:Ca2+-binding RTX toxin-like protein